MFLTIEISSLEPPPWPELAPKYIWAEAIKHPQFLQYLPDQWSANAKILDRVFFYGVLTTLAPDFVDKLIKDCRLKRSQAKKKPPAERNLQGVPMKMIDMLLAEPWVSSKYLYLMNV